MISNYIKDLLAQFHGGVVAYDEGMCKDDPVLAAALWRYDIRGEKEHVQNEK